eukprot:CAMPEP_0113693086 /NCGR_PEP_ID=MMETSP0038_2-20120614/19467_1 /TAXON_ID=2898 /ORGANISM="Cryptomonas paramecium" /LENGTH=329 /DNA_ID=CAMNT_0000615115 /DNA_START=137 /DNA_END=1127 /DNA_ORIENTATION=- /assembly_acc=CAM_ASM_000170
MTHCAMPRRYAGGDDRSSGLFVYTAKEVCVQARASRLAFLGDVLAVCWRLCEAVYFFVINLLCGIPISDFLAKTIGLGPIVCLRPSWNIVFGATIKVLATAARNITRDVRIIRIFSNHSVPSFLLPSSVHRSSNKAPSGEWFSISKHRQSTELDPHDRYILFFHGGAFCLCNTGTHRDMVCRLARATGAHVFAANYRKPPEFPFPAALDDCLEAYRWLLDRVDASRIIFAGDSAGGNLAVTTILACEARGLPTPAGAILLSPWLDLRDPAVAAAGSGVGGSSWARHAAVDYLPADLTEFAQGEGRGPSQEAAVARWGGVTRREATPHVA